MGKKIALFDAKSYDKEYFIKHNKDFGFDIKDFALRLNKDTVSLTKGFDGVCVFVNDTLCEGTLKGLSENGVSVAALRCAGYNNVDVKAAKDLIKLYRVPEYSPYAVAEHIIAMILTLNRKTHKAYNRTREGNFSIAGLLGFDLHGKTAGIVGTGKIGRILAGILKGFGMEILAYDLYPNYDLEEDGLLRYVEIEELYKRSDIISLNCPLTKDTYHLVNTSTISMMKDDVMIVNAGRGGLINTGDLIEALKKRMIGAAALDVYEEEGGYFFEDFSDRIMEDDILARLLTFKNVLITSHQAFFTHEALNNIASTTLGNLKDHFEGKKSKNEIVYKK